MNELPTTTDVNGTQTATDTPQSSGTVQANQNDSALNTSGDEQAAQLQPTSGEAVTLNSVSQATNAQPAAASPNLGLGALSILLFIAAAVLFLSTLRSSKNTTK